MSVNNKYQGAATPFFQWANYQLWLAKGLLVLLLTFMLARVVMLIYYGEGALEIANLINDFWLGFRLDLKTSLMLLFPLWVAGFFLLSGRSQGNNLLHQLTRFWLTFSSLFALYGCMVNFYYYGAFNNYIDVFIFDFFKWDNFVNVSKTLATDYPVIPGLILLIVWAIGLNKYVYSQPRHFFDLREATLYSGSNFYHFDAEPVLYSDCERRD